MHLYKTMQNFLFDTDYSIAIFESKIHVFNYVDILKLTDNQIVLAMSGFTLHLDGENLRVKQLQKREILIEGTLSHVGFSR